GHELSAGDLIPVFSWLFLRGRCRYCGAKIPARCPVSELLCALAFLGVVLTVGVTPEAGRDLILTLLLLSVALVDYDTGLISDGLLAAIGADWLIFAPFMDGGFRQTLKTGIPGALAASVPLLLLSLLMDRVLGRESMGGGDIKLFFVCGLFFPWQSILYFLIVSCVLGILFAAVSSRTVGDPENPKAFPFGPAIAAGAYLSLLTAEPAVAFYLSFF
ncbi:MAG: prepilin peptidase, partial [Oscillibacter sp.]|nr:prepilin peptidase [Oscillibacter sp.]